MPGPLSSRKERRGSQSTLRIALKCYRCALARRGHHLRTGCPIGATLPPERLRCPAFLMPGASACAPDPHGRDADGHARPAVPGPRRVPPSPLVLPAGFGPKTVPPRPVTEHGHGGDYSEFLICEGCVIRLDPRGARICLEAEKRSVGGGGAWRKEKEE